MADIQKMDNGPFIVKGEVKLTDAEGNEYTTKEQYALCRCGQSTNQPFCSGAHRTAGFKEESRAK